MCVDALPDGGDATPSRFQCFGMLPHHPYADPKSQTSYCHAPPMAVEAAEDNFHQAQHVEELQPFISVLRND